MVFEVTTFTCMTNYTRNIFYESTEKFICAVVDVVKLKDVVPPTRPKRKLLPKQQANTTTRRTTEIAIAFEFQFNT